MEKIEIPMGTAQYNLHCKEGIKLIWKKNGRILSFPKDKRFDLKNLRSHSFPLLCVNKNNEGTYTCHVENTTNSPPLKKINVQVSESNAIDKCGNDKKRDLIQPGLTCESYLQEYYPCCEAIPAPPRIMNVETSLGNSDDKCDIYTGLDTSKNPWNVSISWGLRSVGTFGTWGWQIKLVGLDGDPNFGYCVQINSKEQILKWTVPAYYLAVGTTYNVTVQTLPERSESNSEFKIIKTPNWQDMCKRFGRQCKWEICLPVENVTVTNYSSTPLVSWRPSPHYKTEYVIEVRYWAENGSFEDKIIEQNENFVNLTKLNDKNFHKYFVEVRPIFKKGDREEKGRRSERLEFFVDKPNTKPVDHGRTHQSILEIKIIVYAVTGTATLIVLSIFVYIKLKKRPGPDDEEYSNESMGPLIQDVQNNTLTNILLVHDGHCNFCNRATHSLAYVISDSGHINCFLDLCSTNEMAELGSIGWYMEKFKTCEKIVVICTKEAKKTYENVCKDTNFSKYQSTFRFVLNMILGERVHFNNNIQVIPVYFDHSSRDDIPRFLRDRQFYSLPSEINSLLMCLCGFNERPMTGMGEYSLERTNGSQKKIHELESAISVAKRYCGTSKDTFIRSLSCSSAEESSSYVSRV